MPQSDLQHAAIERMDGAIIVVGPRLLGDPNSFIQATTGNIEMYNLEVHSPYH